MPTTAGTQNDAGDILNSLLELCHDLLAGHESLLHVVKRETALALVHRGTDLLKSHIERLENPALRLSQNASNTPDPRALLERAKVRLAGFMSERAAIEATAASLLDLMNGYKRSSEAGKLPEPSAFLAQQLFEEMLSYRDELLAECDDHRDHSSEKACDHDEVTRGRAMPRVDAKAARLTNSTDY